MWKSNHAKDVLNFWSVLYMWCSAGARIPDDKVEGVEQANLCASEIKKNIKAVGRPSWDRELQGAMGKPSRFAL